MEKKYLILSLFLSFILAFFLPDQIYAQQTQVVQGTIVDEKGDPVIGATVKVVGTNTGTITDVDGRFKLNASSNSKLAVSYIGYISQTVSSLANPRIVLKEDLMKLDEVVVVGYGAQKMKNVTGSVVTVATKDISDLSVSNLGSSLTGQVNCLSVSGGSTRPGEAATLTVRQAAVASSFSPNGGSSDPLYVVDDYICPDATIFNNLDASMIESLTVLRDASAAVYGARSAQGVILVKTKRGQIGEPKISYSGQFGYADAVSKPKMLNAYDYGTLWNGVKGASSSSEAAYTPGTDVYQSDELAAMKNLNYNLLNKYWSPAFTQKHSINISGGSNNVTYFAGASYFTQDGNLGWLDYNRWNYRAGADAKIRKWIKASLQISGDYGSQSKAKNAFGGGSDSQEDYYSLLTHLRYIPDNINGLPIAAFGVTNSTQNDIQNYNYKAIQDLNNYVKTTPQNMTINGSLEYDFGWSKLLDGLKMKVAYTRNLSSTKSDELSTFVTTYKMLTRGGTGHHLYTGDGIDLSSTNFESIVTSNGDRVYRRIDNGNNYQLNFYATYARKFGLHDISALFTIEKSENESEYVYGIVSDPLSFTNGQSTSASGSASTEFKRTESGMLSYVGRVNYSYANRYLVEFLMRSDASTKFAPENYWGYFPSLSLGWVMSEESWFKKTFPKIDYFKLRGSVGLLGKDNITAWSWLQTYGIASNYGAIFGSNSATSNLGPGINSSAAPNRNAHWDKSYKTNLGIDTRLLNDKLSINLDAYYDMNREMFVKKQGTTIFPSTVGSSETPTNYGSVNMYGIELSLGWKDKIGKDFSYFVKVSTGYSDNKVLKLYWPSQIAIYEQHPNYRTDQGIWGLDCMGMFRSYQQINEYVAKYHITNYLGLTPDQIRPGMLIYRDVRGSLKSDGSNTYNAPDGKISLDEDKVRISKRSNNPYGFTTNLGGTWKDLSFSAQLSANWGGYTLIDQTAYSGRNSSHTTNTYNDLQYTNLPSFWANNMFVYQDVTDAGGNVVATKNIDARYPNLHYSVNYNASTFWAVSSARVYLRTMTVAYNIPKSLLKKLGVESARINATGQNLLSLYNPYPDHYTSPLAGSYGDYPTLRTISLGVNVSF